MSEDYFFEGKNFNESEGRLFLENLLLKEPWKLNLNETHEFIEHSQEEQNSGRIDHEFVYSLKNEFIENGSSYRIRLELNGLNFTKLQNYVEIPESFSLKYAELHSKNELISSISFYFIIGLYYLLMMLGSVLFILDRKSFSFYHSFVYSSIFSLMIFLQSFNTWNGIWMRYQTELDMNIFMYRRLIDMISNFFQNFVYYFFLFLVTESLFRKSFQKQFQLWKFPTIIKSKIYLDEFLMTIFCLVLFFSHSILLYIIGTNHFNWWVPASLNEDKNALSHYFPAYSSIISSMEAAISEECNNKKN